MIYFAGGKEMGGFKPLYPVFKLVIPVIVLSIFPTACGVLSTGQDVTPTSMATFAGPGEASSAQPHSDRPAPECNSPATPTMSMMEGPYFIVGSPERASLFEAGMKGTKLVLTGTILSTDCKPVAQTLLDFWQANADGQYDNSGYTLRGHQFSDAARHSGSNGLTGTFDFVINLH